ncbi:hypothetical protein ACJRO7_029054 [Eucalyptus globulus]|uniref:glucose-1-phosphate adenylyltransferase n=1 Tax=Eucalyptus globulus TaxID=34317 RepID=A0ABD3JWN7_EUCGL
MVGHYWLRKSELAPVWFLKARIESTLNAVCNFTADVVSSETLQAPMLETPRADPKSVALIILGGGGCYWLIDIPMSNCINSSIRKIFILTQFNSFSLNHHLSWTYNFDNGVSFGDGFVEVLAATQTPGEAGKRCSRGLLILLGNSYGSLRRLNVGFKLFPLDAKNKNVENISILSGDHLYRMNYMNFVQHIDTNADITVSCVPMGDSHASGYGLMKIDRTGQIIQFAGKPKGNELKAMQVDSTLLGLSKQDAVNLPYIASMGIYVFKTDVLLKLLRWSYPSCNDFRSEIIPSVVAEHNVQAYLFNDYWEDIGTIESFFDTNLALTEQPPKFEFYDPQTPFYTSPRFLPPSKVDKCRVSIIEHSIVGVRLRLDYDVEFKDTVMMGANYYQTEAEIASLLAQGKVPIGVGQNAKIRNCIIDKNARIGKNVVIHNTDDVQEADRPEGGFYIRSGITVILKTQQSKMELSFEKKTRKKKAGGVLDVIARVIQKKAG